MLSKVFNRLAILLVPLLSSCITNVEKPNEATGQPGTGTSNPVIGAIAAAQQIVTIIKDVEISFEVNDARDCVTPVPFSSLEIHVFGPDSKEPMTIIEVPKREFKKSMGEVPAGRYRFDLVNSRTGKHLDSKSAQISGNQRIVLRTTNC